jgi:hypothetical protein
VRIHTQAAELHEIRYVSLTADFAIRALAPGADLASSIACW